MKKLKRKAIHFYSMDVLITWVIALAIMGLWYGFEYMEFGTLQWDREVDNIIFVIFVVIIFIAVDQTRKTMGYKRNYEIYEKKKKMYAHTGMKVENKNDPGKYGVVIREFQSGSVQVLESVNPYVICTHDSWKTLSIVNDEQILTTRKE